MFEALKGNIISSPEYGKLQIVETVVGLYRKGEKISV